MPVSTIPGVNSSYQTDKMIEDLMKVERIPLDKKLSKIDSLQSSKRTWQNINGQIARLENASKSLYGYDNPFNEKSAISSDETALGASATRDAENQKFTIKIKQLATADKLKSPALETNFVVPKGKYSFSVGEKNISFYFKGGSLNEFSAMLNKNGKGLLSSSVVKVTNKSQVLLLESALPGVDNRLDFSDDAKTLFSNIGMIKLTPSSSANFKQVASGISLEPNDEENVSMAGLIKENEKFTIRYHFEDIESPYRAFADGTASSENSLAADDSSATTTAELDGTQNSEEVLTDSEEQSAIEQNSETASASVPISGSVTVEDVTVFQASSDLSFFGSNVGASEEAKSDAELKAQQEAAAEAAKLAQIEKEKAAFVESYNRDQEKLKNLQNLITFNRLTGKESVSNLVMSSDSQGVSFSSDNFLDLQSISFNNPFETKRFVIDSVEISGGKGRSYTPINPLELASDAVVELNGLDVTRSSNKIDDLVYGVTLDLKRATNENIDVTIDNNAEAIKEGIINFVYNYNKAIETVLVLTSSDESVINELTYLSADEKEELRQQLGTLKGDNTLNGLKSRLQTLTSNAYKFNSDSKIAILQDMGIGTNVVGGGGFNLNKIRGYLEIDEKKLDTAINENLLDIKNFFGEDSNEDLVVDRGLAYALSNYLKSYTTTGGIISTKTATYDTQIKSLNKETATLEQKLQAKERDYKIKYGRMEGMIKELQSNTKALENLNNNGRQ